MRLEPGRMEHLKVLHSHLSPDKNFSEKYTLAYFASSVIDEEEKSVMTLTPGSSSRRCRRGWWGPRTWGFWTGSVLSPDCGRCTALFPTRGAPWAWWQCRPEYGASRVHSSFNRKFCFFETFQRDHRFFNFTTINKKKVIFVHLSWLHAMQEIALDAPPRTQSYETHTETDSSYLSPPLSHSHFSLSLSIALPSFTLSFLLSLPYLTLSLPSLTHSLPSFHSLFSLSHPLSLSNSLSAFLSLSPLFNGLSTSLPLSVGLSTSLPHFHFTGKVMRW